MFGGQYVTHRTVAHAVNSTTRSTRMRTTCVGLGKIKEMLQGVSSAKSPRNCSRCGIERCEMCGLTLCDDCFEAGKGPVIYEGKICERARGLARVCEVGSGRDYGSREHLISLVDALCIPRHIRLYTVQRICCSFWIHLRGHKCPIDSNTEAHLWAAFRHAGERTKLLWSTPPGPALTAAVALSRVCPRSLWVDTISTSIIP